MIRTFLLTFAVMLGFAGVAVATSQSASACGASHTSASNAPTYHGT